VYTKRKNVKINRILNKIVYKSLNETRRCTSFTIFNMEYLNINMRMCEGTLIYYLYMEYLNTNINMRMCNLNNVRFFTFILPTLHIIWTRFRDKTPIGKFSTLQNVPCFMEINFLLTFVSDNT